jgi:hypothetical protein
MRDHATATRMDIFRGLLPPASADDFIPALVRAYLSAYEDASARYDRGVGCDSNTFGTDVWRFSWFRLDQELWPIPGVRTTRAESSFAILVGDLVIRSYRGGPDEKYNIDEFDFGAGSRIRREIPWQNYEQLTLFSEDSELALDRRLHLTIVHSGNPSIGCTGLWVGLAMPQQWEWVEPLYEFEAVSAAPPPPTGFTPFTEREEPEIRIDLMDEDGDEAYEAHLEIVDDADAEDAASEDEDPV